MSATELKISAKNLIDSLDTSDRGSMDILVSVVNILNVFANGKSKQDNRVVDAADIKFKRSPLSDRVKNMSVKIELPTEYNEKELYYNYLSEKYK